MSPGKYSPPPLTADRPIVDTPAAAAGTSIPPMRSLSSYQLRGNFYMQPTVAGASITLTIDPGVTIKLGGPLAATPSFKLGSGPSATTTP